MNWPKKREKKKRSSMESKVEKTEHGFYVMPIQGFVFGTFRYWLHTTGGLFVSYLVLEGKRERILSWLF
jgi:hypothetical protein